MTTKICFLNTTEIICNFDSLVKTFFATSIGIQHFIFIFKIESGVEKLSLYRGVNKKSYIPRETEFIHGAIRVNQIDLVIQAFCLLKPHKSEFFFTIKRRSIKKLVCVDT